MTSILNSVQTGLTATGLRIVIAAQEKMGKTTLCSMAPSPVLIPLEVGYSGVNMPKLPMLQHWEHILQLMEEILAACASGQFQYKTICFDSATALERHLHNWVIRQDPASMDGKKKTITMETAHGGYGRAATMANAEFDKFLQKCDQLAVYYGINIVMTAHVFSSKIADPTSGEYDSWDILLHSPKNNKTYGKREMLTQWADLVGFLYEPMYVTGSEGNGMVRGVSAGKGRVIGVSRTPAYVAGNRFAMTGEIPLPPPPENGWNHLANALYQAKGIDVYTR